jgi:D-serine deaminase-like pyridoxal phosphate-dependent protein
MTFKKGQSGNPGGKPKELKEIQVEARKMSFDALKTLETVCKNSKSPAAARVAAANAILDRAYGKPPQFISGDADQFRSAIEMSDEELLAIIAGGDDGAAAKG